MKELFRNLYALTTASMALIAFGLALYFKFVNKKSNGLADIMFKKHLSQVVLFGAVSSSLAMFNQEIYLFLILCCLPYIWYQYKFIKYIQNL